MEANVTSAPAMDPKALASFGRKLKKLTAALVKEAEMKHRRLMLNDLSVEQGGGPVLRDLSEWTNGFESGAMMLFDGMLTPSERAVSQVVAHDAAARFAEVGVCPAPVFIALVFDKMSAAGVEKLGRFCDPGFCVAWRGDGGKRYFEPMGVWMSKHKGESVYEGFLSGELEYLCAFGEDGDRKALTMQFEWDDNCSNIP